MASEIIGRAPCPECGFEAAHVKRSEKCVYRYCPGCGIQTHARTPEQVKNMTAKMRPVEAVAPTGPTPTLTAKAKDAPTPPANGHAYRYRAYAYAYQYAASSSTT